MTLLLGPGAERLELPGTERLGPRAVVLGDGGAPPPRGNFDTMTVHRRRRPRLLVTDMDSTLIQQEVIDEIAREAGRYAEVAEVTARAMEGAMDFAQSLRARVAKLEGVPVTALDRVRGRVQLSDGAPRLVAGMHAMGGRVGVVSGGFIEIVEPIAKDLGIDYAAANRLAVRDGALTGELEGPIVGPREKVAYLEAWAAAAGASLGDTVAVGDGANDLPMLERAGLGVAFNAKPAVQEALRHRVNVRELDAVLYVLGWSDAEIDALIHEARPA